MRLGDNKATWSVTHAYALLHNRPITCSRNTMRPKLKFLIVKLLKTDNYTDFVQEVSYNWLGSHRTKTFSDNSRNYNRVKPTVRAVHILKCLLLLTWHMTINYYCVVKTCATFCRNDALTRQVVSTAICLIVGKMKWNYALLMELLPNFTKHLALFSSFMLKIKIFQ